MYTSYTVLLRACALRSTTIAILYHGQSKAAVIGEKIGITVLPQNTLLQFTALQATLYN